MKQTILFTLLLLLLAYPTYAATLNRNMPNQITPGTDTTVTLTLSGLITGEEVALEESLPNGVTLKEWTITNTKETKDKINTRSKTNAYAWSFTPTTETAAITYTLSVSKNTAGNAEFSAVYFDKSGFNKDSKTVSFTTQTASSSTTSSPEPSQAPLQPLTQKPQTSSQQSETIKSPTKPTSKRWWIILAVLIGASLAYYLWTQMQPKKNNNRW